MREVNANIRAKSYARLLRIQVIEGYGGKCECCGETRLHFLSIDHKFNDGSQHRESLRSHGRRKSTWIRRNGYRGGYGSTSVWNELKRLGYPKDRYRCLCYNCNLGRHRNWDKPGVCPHEIERGEIVSEVLGVIPALKNNQMDWLSGKPVGGS